MKTTGFCFTWYTTRLSKLRETFQAQTYIIFQACFLAIAICFLDKLFQFTSPFYNRCFAKNSRKMLEIRFILMN